MNQNPINAEDLPYWQTSQSAADTWIDRTKKMIQDAGGYVMVNAYGEESGRAAFILSFKLEGQIYKIMWPVLVSKTKNERAARIQAATMIYHDVKAKLVTALVLGVKAAFLPYLVLPNGVVAMSLQAPEIGEAIPRVFLLERGSDGE